MNKALLIENNNTPKSFKNIFNDNIINFNFIDSNYSHIDKYISNHIIKEIQKKKFDVIFIKDSLSSNYFELYGLVLSYHIRLSKELNEKRYIPIVILSDLDGYTLNKLNSMAMILFTKNIFITSNSLKSIKNFNTRHSSPCFP